MNQHWADLDDAVEIAPMEADVLVLRAGAQVIASAEARQLRRVASLAARCEADARAELAVGPRVPGQPHDEEIVSSAVTGEVMVVLGVSRRAAEQLVAMATRLTAVLTGTLAALDEGRLDLSRARVMAEATEDLDDESARAVEALVLPTAGAAAWDGPSPRAWRDRVTRAVVQVDADAARRRREKAVAARCVRSWPVGDGTGVLQMTAADHDVAVADQVVTDLAHAWPATGPDGQKLGMDQRRADALMDVFHRLRDGRDLPQPAATRTRESGPDDTDCPAAPTAGADVPHGEAGHLGPLASRDDESVTPPITSRLRRERDVGIVLHADTLFGDGPAAADPGEVRGLGPPAPIDPASAAELARAELARGAGSTVLLVDAGGVLDRVVPVGFAPAGGWTRESLAAKVRAALPSLPPLHTDGYPPTDTISRHVRAAQPRCVSYDCPRASYRCDLDHDTAWPRGPTDAANLCPRCRRHHQLKTSRLVRTRLRTDGSITTTMLTGLSVTTRPEPLPGYGPGEGYGPPPTPGPGATGRSEVWPAA